MTLSKEDQEAISRGTENIVMAFMEAIDLYTGHDVVLNENIKRKAAVLILEKAVAELNLLDEEMARDAGSKDDNPPVL